MAVLNPEDRVAEWLEFLADPEALAWTTSEGVVVTLSRISASGSAVKIHTHATREDGTVAFDDDHVIVNPPTGVPDGGQDEEGNPTFVKDIRAVLRDVVERNLP